MMRLIAAIAAILMCSSIARAQEHNHQHPPEHAQIHTDFYSTWQRPDDRRISCCNLKDCEPVEAKVIGGHWHVLRKADQRWLRVPPSQVEHERESPDGRNHACFQRPEVGITVYCAIFATGG